MDPQNAKRSERKLKECINRDGRLSDILALAHIYAKTGRSKSAWELLESIDDDDSLEVQELRRELTVSDAVSGLELYKQHVIRSEGVVYTEEYDLFANAAVHWLSIKVWSRPSSWSGRCEFADGHKLPLGVIQHQPLDFYVGVGCDIKWIVAARFLKVGRLESSRPLVTFTGLEIPECTEQYDRLHRKLSRYAASHTADVRLQ